MRENKWVFVIVAVLFLTVAGFVAVNVQKAQNEAAPFSYDGAVSKTDRAEQNKEYITFLKQDIYNRQQRCKATN